jgi:hypothetical protein
MNISLLKENLFNQVYNILEKQKELIITTPNIYIKFLYIHSIHNKNLYLIKLKYLNANKKYELHYKYDYDGSNLNHYRVTYLRTQEKDILLKSISLLDLQFILIHIKNRSQSTQI